VAENCGRYNDLWFAAANLSVSSESINVPEGQSVTNLRRHGRTGASGVLGSIELSSRRIW
jgi:hypothetical protein